MTASGVHGTRTPATLLWLAGTGLRLTILAVPPVLAMIRDDLALTATQVGLLSSIPPAMFALAAVSITLLGVKMPTGALFVVVGLAGASTIGTQIVANAYAGQFYPMAIRGTGLGWALGVGRSGAILAPIVIGVLVGMNLPLQQNFIAIAIPAVIGMVAVLLIDHRRSASAPAAESSTSPAMPAQAARS